MHMELSELKNTIDAGFEDSMKIRLRCYKGYQMERDLMERIFNIFPHRTGPAPEISLFDGAVKGHPDFLFDGYPADCKTVPLDEHLPANGKVSRKIYWQMQAYMYGMHVDKALVIFESRETGRICDVWLNANRSIQQSIEAKLHKLTNPEPVTRNS